MSKIAITGAAGGVGRQALKTLSDHEVTPITHREHEDIDSVVLDLDETDRLNSAFAGNEIVIHLAANPNADADWDSVLSSNIDGTHNVYEAARRQDVDRVIFASTNHLTAQYNIVDGETGTMVTDSATVIAPDDPTNPDSFYGISKITGEALGKYYAQRHGIEVINFRIGWLLTEEELKEKNDRPPEQSRFSRALWLSPRDCRHAFRRAVDAEIPENPLTAHIISENTDRYLSITETIQGLGYSPVDDSMAVVKK